MLPPPHNAQSIQGCLDDLRSSPSSHQSLLVVAKLSARLPIHYPLTAARRTLVMAVVNLTPDSFSDGGEYNLSDTDGFKQLVLQILADGAHIIDIGGQSTRPNATSISGDEELQRILPAIRLIRSMPEAKRTTISIDTYYASVAEQAVSAGADIINDVSGGRLDKEMLATAARLQTPLILMHSRGTPETMKDLTDYPGGLIQDIADELAEQIRLAELAGVRRWRIILDPGIGFAKNQNQNLELLRRLPDLKNDPRLMGFPWVVGASRKGFIGKITGVNQANERTWGTAAAVTASVNGGADIVRVHDVAEMSQVIKMADAMFRVENTAQKSTAFSPSHHSLEETGM